MPNIEFLTEKRFTLSAHLIEVAVKNNLSLAEFLLLVYFEDAIDKTFDVESICKYLHLTAEEVLHAFNNLLKLDLIQLETVKDGLNKRCEKISLVPLYQAIFEKTEKEKRNENRETIYDIFQKELGRKISPFEYDIVNNWLEKGYSDELILGALKEAVFNGVSSLRYIDKILYEWKKKGYKKMGDVTEGMKKECKKTESNVELFDYNWLEDEG